MWIPFSGVINKFDKHTIIIITASIVVCFSFFTPLLTATTQRESHFSFNTTFYYHIFRIIFTLKRCPSRKKMTKRNVASLWEKRLSWCPIGIIPTSSGTPWLFSFWYQQQTHIKDKWKRNKKLLTWFTWPFLLIFYS